VTTRYQQAKWAALRAIHGAETTGCSDAELFSHRAHYKNGRPWAASGEHAGVAARLGLAIAERRRT